MAPYSSTLAWKISWTEERGGLQSMGSLGVGHNWVTFTFHFHALEKEMATHASVLAWRIPGTGEPGGLPSMGSQSWTRLTQLSSSSSSSSSSLVSQQSLSSLSSNFCSIGQWKVLQIGIRVLSLPALDYFRETMFWNRHVGDAGSAWTW